VHWRRGSWMMMSFHAIAADDGLFLHHAR
jgi:hypothetical protein